MPHVVLCVQLQNTNADLRNLLLQLDPDGMRDKLRTAAKTKQTQVRWKENTHDSDFFVSLLFSCILILKISEDEEDKRIAAMGGGQSRLKNMAEDKDNGKGDDWYVFIEHKCPILQAFWRFLACIGNRLLHRHKANKVGEHDEKALEHARNGETVESEKQAALQDERKKIEEERRRKKREKKKKLKEEAARKEGGEKKKKKKKKPTSEDGATILYIIVTNFHCSHLALFDRWFDTICCIGACDRRWQQRTSRGSSEQIHDPKPSASPQRHYSCKWFVVDISSRVIYHSLTSYYWLWRYR